MVAIKVSNNFPAVQRALAQGGRQMPFALARALTRTGQEVRTAEQQEIRRIFDRPTPFTLNSMFLQPATKDQLLARVFFKEGKAPQPFILPNIEGGDRPLKRFEQRLRLVGIMKADEIAVPGQGAQLDSYGNISRGQITKILSQLRTAVVAGDFSNASNSKRSRAKRAREEYFASGGSGKVVGSGAWKGGNKAQHLPRGIWLRRSFGPLGTAVKPVLIFVKRPAKYQQRFKFFEIANRVINERFPANFEQSFAAALRRANLK